jgi:ATP-dependent DNA ligase
MNFPLLYKVNAKKQVQIWEIYTEGKYIFTKEGLIDGKLSEHNMQVIDKKRSPTLEKQAELMAASKWNDKKKSYWESIEEAKRVGTDLTHGGYVPMLAHSCPTNINFDHFWYVQPKLDGTRCISRKVDGEVRLFSRKGLPIDSVPHINRSLNKLMEDGEIFDGELYQHGQDFNESSGKIRSKDHDNSEMDYWLYDFPRIRGLTEAAPYEQRASDLIMEQMTRGTNIVITPTFKVDHWTDIKNYHDQAVEEGFEGVILRNPKMGYENKRSKNLLKYKEFQDSEFLIIGYTEGKGSLENAVGSFTCTTPEERWFSAKLKAPVAELKRLYQNPNEFMNKHLTVKYQGKSVDGVPRFPVGLRIR